MTFFVILLIILLYFLLRPAFRTFMMYRKYQRAMREAFFRAQSSQGRGANGRSRSYSNPEPPHKKKIITKDMGEYVAYEEISCSIKQENDSHSTQTVTEEQITDIEWEDIKE